MDKKEICFICNEVITSDASASIVTRGLDTLRSVSLKRCDDKHKLLSNVTSVKVHKICRQQYTLVRGQEFRYKNLEETKRCPGSPIKSKVRKIYTEFDFTKNCFICGCEANLQKEIKKSVKYRSKISHVTDLSFQKNLEDIIKKTNDNVAKDIRKRISCVDLFAVNAKYHSRCYQNKCLNVFMTDSAPSTSRGRPMDDSLTHDMEKVFDYLDNNDDCQFTLEELCEVLGTNHIYPLNIFIFL